jgi:predicted ferric reductase
MKRLTSKDVLGAALTLAAVMVAAAVVNGWGWPLLGDYRAGTIALAVVGFAMCGAASDYGDVRWSHPLVIVAAALGTVALGLIVAGLIWATAELVFWLAAVIVALWFVSTVRHLITRRGFEQAHPAFS